MTLSSPEQARAAVTGHIRRLKRLPGFREPTAEQYELYEQHQERARAAFHNTQRDKRLISIDLGVHMAQFEALFIGRSVLDVGCGTGILSGELARLNKTRVTALDNDPVVLAQVRRAKNLTPVLGSGYDIPAAVNGQTFGAVISSFSSYYWAKNEEERRAAITSAIDSCDRGGKAIFVPIIAEPNVRDRYRRILAAHPLGSAALGPAETEELRATVVVNDWLDVVGVETLLAAEDREQIQCTFLPSRDNAKNIPLGNLGGVLERYSVIADVL